jgi:hypothetical protein
MLSKTKFNFKTHNMGKIVMNVSCGDSFGPTSERAKQMSINNSSSGLFDESFHIQNVEFDFNGVKCVVNVNTNLEWLYRDYCNAHTMEWPVVGPDCLEQYEPEVEKELKTRTAAEEAKYALEMEEYREKERKEKELFLSKIEGIEIELSDEEYWNETKRINAGEGYGEATIEFAECWAKLMQSEIKQGKTVVECADKTSFELGFLGITGFMYGMAVNILSRSWKHGEELRKWHNKEYGHEGDGVVNPAVLTLKV